MKVNDFLNPGAGIMLILVFWLGFRNFELTQESNHLNDHTLSLIQDSTAFEKRISQMGDSISIQRETLLSETQSKKVLEKEYQELKKIAQNTKVITQTEIKKVFIPVHDTVRIMERPEGLFMKLPQSFSDSTAHFQFNSTLNESGLTINSLTIPNKTSVSIGMRKESFFRKAEPVVLVSHSNPYVSTVGMTNVTVDHRTPFYETKGFNIGVGFLAGFLIAK